MIRGEKVLETMQGFVGRARWFVVCIGLLGTVHPAVALHAHPIFLRDALNGSESIFIAKVTDLDPRKPSMVLVVDQDLKGKHAQRRLPVNLTGDKEARKLNHVPQLLKRLAPNLPLIIFVIPKDDGYTAYAFTNGTWFQILGTRTEGKVHWAFTHCEPYFRGTFSGTTEELRQLICDVLAGKKQPPDPDEKAKPGLGPEVPSPPGSIQPPDAARQAALRSGPFFAVIPTVLVGGPLAVLAMLFPAVFGGLTGQLRRWLMLITVISINSTLLMLYRWLGHQISDRWWGNESCLWLAMTLVTILGVCWSWRRHLRRAQGVVDRGPCLSWNDSNGDNAQCKMQNAESKDCGFAPGALDKTQLSKLQSHSSFIAIAPGRGEHIALWVMSLVALGVISYCWYRDEPLLAFPWKLVLTFSVGIWLATANVLYFRIRWRRSINSSVPVILPTEGVALLGMVATATLLMVSPAPSASVPLPVAYVPLPTAPEPADATDTQGKSEVVLVGQVWSWGGNDIQGTVASSPLVQGDKVYISVAFGNYFNSYGAVYNLDRDTGKEIWKFNAGGKMKQGFSTPCFADGRIYVGEGWHQDSACKLYCLNAETGELIWDFTTRSHTESSPCVAEGKVFFGAGDDGLYCLDAAKGKKLWHYQKDLHIDSSPVVVGKRLYCGAGVVGEAEHTRKAVLCLNADTGKEIWIRATELPVLGTPQVSDGQVLIGTGNGNFGKSDLDNPAGTLLCLEAESGKIAWQCRVPDSVVTAVAVDHTSAYFGCRDGHCYCVDRQTGKVRWKTGLGSPVVASPVLMRCSGCGSGQSVYALGSAGRVACLDAKDGKVLWSHKLADQKPSAPALVSTPAVVTLRLARGQRRRIYFGAGFDSPGRGSTPHVLCLEDHSAPTFANPSADAGRLATHNAR